jgi:hypothetical protein
MSGLQTVQNWIVAEIVAIAAILQQAILTFGLQAVQKWTVAGTCAVQNVQYGLMTRWGDFMDATVQWAFTGIQIVYDVADAALQRAMSAATFATILAFRIEYWRSAVWSRAVLHVPLLSPSYGTHRLIIFLLAPHFCPLRL